MMPAHNPCRPRTPSMAAKLSDNPAATDTSRYTSNSRENTRQAPKRSASHAASGAQTTVSPRNTDEKDCASRWLIPNSSIIGAIATLMVVADITTAKLPIPSAAILMRDARALTFTSANKKPGLNMQDRAAIHHPMTGCELHKGRLGSGHGAEAGDTGQRVGMFLFVGAGAAILQHHHIEVTVMGIADGRLNHRLGAHAAAVDALDAFALEQQFQPGLIERRNPMLDDVPVLRLRCQILMHLTAPGVHLQDAVLGNGTENLGVGVGFTVIIRESHAHEAHLNTLGTRPGNGACGALNHLTALDISLHRRLAAGSVGVNQIVLHIQNQVNTLHFNRPYGC